MACCKLSLLLSAVLCAPLAAQCQSTPLGRARSLWNFGPAAVPRRSLQSRHRKEKHKVKSLGLEPREALVPFVPAKFRRNLVHLIE
jgi:hypothetical protein